MSGITRDSPCERVRLRAPRRFEHPAGPGISTSTLEGGRSDQTDDVARVDERRPVGLHALRLARAGDVALRPLPYAFQNFVGKVWRPSSGDTDGTTASRQYAAGYPRG